MVIRKRGKAISLVTAPDFQAVRLASSPLPGQALTPCSRVSEFKSDEAGRLAALERLNILDTAREEPFENIVALVKQVLNIPICAISLIDQDRQWFKAECGLNASETPREISFCTSAIMSNEPMIVPNALEDPRFSAGDLVLGPPHIRSYAGAPLTTPDGYNIGTLCIIDTIPRTFSEFEITVLKNFATLVLAEIELRQAASIDSLTGALARGAWSNRAEADVSRAIRYTRPVSLMVLDLDRFKQINDRFGHPVGDKVLKRVVEIIEPLLRKSDLFGRFGGEEFVLMLPETHYLDAMKLAHRIHENLRADETCCLDDCKVTISIGVTALWPLEHSLETMLERADRALYLAKQAGRDRTHGIAAPRPGLEKSRAA